ncbi:MAG: acyl-CoA dehydrogenase family protein [Actinomycetota bacterium]
MSNTALAADTVIAEATRIADTVLFPGAEARDRSDTLPRDGLDSLAAAGLFGIAGPSSAGGSALDPLSTRRVVATVGGGCGATFFVWVQHHGVVRDVATSENTAIADELLAPMCAGEIICGTAFAHVRRVGEPAVRAKRVADGWRLDGFAPWATSWGIAPRFSIYALAEDGTLVKSMICGADEHGDPDGITAIPLQLLLLGSTGTVALRFDGYHVSDDAVIAIDDFARWSTFDRLRSSIGQPAALGVAERAVAVMRSTASDDHTAHTAERLDTDIGDAWMRDTELHDAIAQHRPGDDADALIAAASGHRASCLLLAQRAATASIAAAGGRAMDLDQPGQRLAREATFYTIQAQTADGRSATLRAIAEA